MVSEIYECVSWNIVSANAFPKFDIQLGVHYQGKRVLSYCLNVVFFWSSKAVGELLQSLGKTNLGRDHFRK